MNDKLIGPTGCRQIRYLSGNHDEDVFLRPCDLGNAHWNLLMGCHHQGACDDDVEEASRYFELHDFKKARAYVQDTGATLDDPNDEEEILRVYLWILSGDIQEELRQ